MKNLYLPFLLLSLTLGCSSKNNEQTTETAMNPTYLFLLGTYTEQPEEGINFLQFDPEARKIEAMHVASDIDNPSFIIANADQTLVFATEETGSEQGGKVTSFKLDKANGTLEKINSVYTGGDSPCHLSLDPTERFLVVSNYSGGNVTVIPADQEGKLSSDIQLIQHEGSSINPNRQQAPHVHSAVFHPSENRVFVADLGTDKIYLYDFNENDAAPLSPAAHPFTVNPGAGPRHIHFNEAGDRLYLIHELTAEVGVYVYEGGEISHLETHSLVSDGFTGDVGAAEVRISPDGNYLYASNRGEAHTLTVFEVNNKDGRLTQIQHISSQGEAPRNFFITPDGKFLVCGNQNSDEIRVFDRNQEDGTISPSQISFSVSKPVYFYSLD
jgi:6-phosphogluconolactonase